MRLAIVLGAALPMLALGACGTVDQRRQQTWEFETARVAGDVLNRSTAQFLRTGYTVVRSDPTFLEAEKRAEGAWDVLSVRVNPSGSIRTVEVHALTERPAGGGRAQSPSASSSVLVDGQRLVDALR